MLTREQVIELLRDSYAFLASEFGVRRIGLIGSFVKGHSHEASDIDILVEFARPIGLRFVKLVDYLENLLGRKVEVLTPAEFQNIRSQRVAKSITQSVVYV